mgnify:CR=1 FL=1
MSLFDNPIYYDDPIFGNLKKEYCPTRADICNNLQGFSVINGTGTIAEIPNCSGGSFTFTNDSYSSPSGCCMVDVSNETCDAYFDPADIKFEGKKISLYPTLKDQKIKLKKLNKKSFQIYDNQFYVKIKEDN